MSSWRDTASEQTENDLDRLCNTVLPFAEQTLGWHGEFLPFGAAVTTDGQIEMLAADPALGERPQSQDVLDSLLAGARTRSADHRAFAMVADVRAGRQDAVRVELEHRDGVAIVMLAPYTRSRLTKRVTLGEMRLSNGTRQIWGD